MIRVARIDGTARGTWDSCLLFTLWIVLAPTAFVAPGCGGGPSDSRCDPSNNLYPDVDSTGKPTCTSIGEIATCGLNPDGSIHKSPCTAPLHGSPACSPTSDAAKFACSFSCETGYHLSQGTCVADPCTAAGAGCQAGERCIPTANLDAPPDCSSCLPGYTRDPGGACLDTNGCLLTPCFAGVTCTDVPAPATGRTCGACPTGYTGDGATCTDIDECLTSHGGCDAIASCTNTAGGRTCTCPATFVTNDGGATCGCPSGKTNCSGVCVDLATDPNNCGACGYGAVAGRSCVGGKPSPAWLNMATASGPTSIWGEGGYDGLHYVVFDELGVHLYDLTSNTWSVSGTAIPFTWPTSNVSACGGYAIVSIALEDRKAYFFWNGTAAYLFHDDASGGWFEGPFGAASGAPSARYYGETLTYDGTSVHLVYGAGGCMTGGAPGSDSYYNVYSNGASFDLTNKTWSSVSSDPTPVCQSGRVPISPGSTYVNGTLLYVGGIVANTDYCWTGSASRFDPSSNTWLAPYVLSGTTTQWTTSTLLTLGTRALLFGDQTEDRAGALLIDPRGTTVATAAPANSAGGRYYTAAAYTGRAILYWGGIKTLVSTQYFNTGAAGVLNGDAISWKALPASTLSARAVFASDNGRSCGNGAQDTQSSWTGRELVIVGGWDGTSHVRDGARYQPPVGCVCPRASDTPSTIPDGCGGVTNVADPSCTP